MKFLLVLERDLPLPVFELGRPLAGALERPRADITRALALSRGILDLGLREPEARRAASLLTVRGIGVRVVPEERVPALPEPHAVVDADPLASGLDIQRIQGMDPHLVPWRDISLIAVGSVTFRHSPPPQPVVEGTYEEILTRARSLAGSLLGSSGWGSVQPITRDVFLETRKRRERRETVLCLDVVRLLPPVRYRVIAGRFVYDYLGDRLALSSAENFRTLVMDLAEMAPDTLLSNSTRIWLEDPRSRDHRFPVAAAFDAYVRWLAAWREIWGRRG